MRLLLERMMDMTHTSRSKCAFRCLCAALTATMALTFATTATADTARPSGSDTTAILSVWDDGASIDVTSALTDGNSNTVWVQSTSASPDLTLTLARTSVSEIWIRSGNCSSQNAYYTYARPTTLAVTLYHNYGRDTVTYRYTLADAYQPNLSSDDWQRGYQRLLLPQEYSAVTQIDLTIEESTGTGWYKAAISDIALRSGTHATATPRTYTTATPRPYVAYVTPTPDPSATATPTSPLIQVITPVPTAQPTQTPVRSTDVPAPTAEPVYPSSGTVALLNQRAATRSGPGTRFDEPGSFYSAGDAVNVISKAWDEDSGLWWYQIELNTSDGWIRAYTPAKRVDLDTNYVPTETNLNDQRKVITSGPVYFGPSTTYRKYGWSWIYEGDAAKICQISGEWAQIEYYSYAKDVTRRGWVKLDTLSPANN